MTCPQPLCFLGGAQAEKVEPLGGGAESQALGALGTRAVVIRAGHRMLQGDLTYTRT